MQSKSSYNSFYRFLEYAKPWKWKIVLSSIYSILNKLFDIAPEILIGIAVDLVVQKDDSIIAQLGFESIQSQIIFLAIATFLIWAFESIFQYLYSISWRNLAQSIEHNIRIISIAVGYNSTLPNSETIRRRELERQAIRSLVIKDSKTVYSLLFVCLPHWEGF